MERADWLVPNPGWQFRLLICTTLTGGAIANQGAKCSNHTNRLADNRAIHSNGRSFIPASRIDELMAISRARRSGNRRHPAWPKIASGHELPAYFIDGLRSDAWICPLDDCLIAFNRAWQLRNFLVRYLMRMCVVFPRQCSEFILEFCNLTQKLLDSVMIRHPDIRGDLAIPCRLPLAYA